MAEETQRYFPYRPKLLNSNELRDFNELCPARAGRDTILLWLQIVAAWSAVALWPAWWTVSLAIPVVGTRYYALYIIGHDGLHRRLFRDRRTNDLWNDLLILGAIGAITRLNRANHMRHHATLALPSDPDRYKYTADNKPTRLRYVLALTGLPYLARAVGNVFFARSAPTILAEPPDSYSIRDLAILGAWQVGLIAGLSVGIGWWAYPVLWLLPVYVFTFAADITRVFLEHSIPNGEADGATASRLVTFTSTWLERQFFAPMNMNFHTAHHLWPSIPYYNLARADRAIRQSSACDRGLVWRGSYLGYLWRYGRALPWRADPLGCEARAS
jgi:fatty acid desaturase